MNASTLSLSSVSVKPGLVQSVPFPGKARLSDAEIEAVVKVFPQYALWLVTGETAPECGQTSPEYDEANRNLANPNAG
jgi:hypothetical protein